MRKLVTTVGSVGVTGLVAISLFAARGGVFGPLNDVCNGAMAALTAALAWRLYPWHRTQAPRQSGAVLGAAWAGALIAVVGSILVLLRVTGWYLAGLVSSFGYALIGVWLERVSAAAEQSGAWPRALARLGRVTGAISAVGLAAVPGILGGMDDVGAAPWWVSASLANGLGWLVMYPFWCLWLGRRLSTPAAARPEVMRA